jgi:hypothetical protein
VGVKQCVLVGYVLFLIVSMPFCFAQELSLTYDANGNLITGDGKYRVYNSLNQLSKVYNGTNTSILLEEYTYHPVEERVVMKKSYNTSGSLIEIVYYINQNYMQVVSANGSISNYTYYYLQGQLIAQDVNGIKTYMHTDAKGDVVAVSNSSGSVIEKTSYSPFGEVLSGGRQSRFSYEGKESDAGLGYIPLNGLVSYWSFNDGTSDEVSNNTGVVVNATKSSGLVRDAYTFDGVADYIVANDSANLDINGSITISAWVNPSSSTAGYVVSKYTSYMIHWTSNTLQGGIWIGGTWTVLATSSTVPTNTWTHVTFTYNKSNAYIYINGVLNASGTNTNSIDMTNHKLFIGARNATNRDRDFNGTIDEIGIWNRALTPTEAKSLYDYGRTYDENAEIDFNARMLNQKTKQYSQADTQIRNIYLPQTINRYSFEENSPYNKVDPTGHIVWDIIDVGFAAWDINTFREDRTWANAGWAALSILSLAPILPNIAGYIRHGEQGIKAADKAIDAARAVDKTKEVIKTTTTLMDKASDLGFRGELLHTESHLRHAKEMGFETPELYEQAAKNFVSSRDKNILTYQRTRGSFKGEIMRYNSKTKEFSVINKKGYIKTYYKTDYDYFLKQINDYNAIKVNI